MNHQQILDRFRELGEQIDDAAARARIAEVGKQQAERERLRELCAAQGHVFTNSPYQSIWTSTRRCAACGTDELAADPAQPAPFGITTVYCARP